MAEIYELNKLLREGYDEGYIDKSDLDAYRRMAKETMDKVYTGSIGERDTLYCLIHNGVEDNLYETEREPGFPKRIVQATLTGWAK